ncbi:DUF5370 family protein [Pseudalkalibacillus caeni]|uniref:YbxH family protein n=1 Tax=Exobacillus caeni TaxID=2574798 RepID=A0A5R9F7G3_9BACL|nr:DUF5370 family protein [Pseudalkalibacillus caeni]TLS38971.1 hypothetical protein FCL54_01270 [Pseudalkalibacillus caeni]
MGAIEREGYIFEIEHDTIHRTGALHIYCNGDFVDEITFDYTGNEPNEEKLEELIDDYLKKHK